ncbi:MAG: hypothetical protein M3Y84_00540 [Acidobacteriota bacterium]|nr:hypothetical protein [Acidobacteriota bacterium]
MSRVERCGQKRLHTLARKPWEECSLYKLEVELATNNTSLGKVNVCLAGAPLFEGRWIPDAGEIITAQLYFLVLRVAFIDV